MLASLPLSAFPPFEFGNLSFISSFAVLHFVHHNVLSVFRGKIPKCTDTVLACLVCLDCVKVLWSWRRTDPVSPSSKLGYSKVCGYYGRRCARPSKKNVLCAKGPWVRHPRPHYLASHPPLHHLCRPRPHLHPALRPPVVRPHREPLLHYLLRHRFLGRRG